MYVIIYEVYFSVWYEVLFATLLTPALHAIIVDDTDIDFDYHILFNMSVFNSRSGIFRL